MSRLKVINLFAGPGAGKSTTAAGVFSGLKQEGINAELVTEYAKDLTWEGRHETLANQIYVFGKQFKRLQTLVGKVDVVVTDSPLLLSMIYNRDWIYLNPLVLEAWNKFENSNIFIERVKPYNPAGRNQTEDEACALDRKICDLLESNNQIYHKVKGNRQGVDDVVAYYLSTLNKSHLHQ